MSDGRSNRKAKVVPFVDRLERDRNENLNSLVSKAKLMKLEGLKWFTEFGHLNRGDMLTSEQHRCSNEKKKF